MQRMIALDPKSFWIASYASRSTIILCARTLEKARNLLQAGQEPGRIANKRTE